MRRFHISSRPEIQPFQLRATHKQTELLNAVHHILERSCLSRIENVRTKPAPLSTASSRSKAEFLGVVPSADLHPGLLVQTVQQANRGDAHFQLQTKWTLFVQTRVAMAPDDLSSNPSPRSSCEPRSTNISTQGQAIQAPSLGKPRQSLCSDQGTQLPSTTSAALPHL